MADDWVSPTGHNDPGGKWGSETNAYDESLATHAAEQGGPDYLELTHVALSCDKVRFYTYDWYSTHALILDVYYSGAWNNIYSADPPEGEWVEVEIGSTQTVTKARVATDNTDGNHSFVEFDFNQVAAPPAAVANFMLGCNF